VKHVFVVAEEYRQHMVINPLS